MGAAIGGTLPLAVGVALSPLPIIAVVLMLTTPRAGLNGPLFVLGWLAGLAAVGAIVLAVAGPAGPGSATSPATWVSALKLALGVALLVLAVRQFRGRPRDGAAAELPKWMARLDGTGPLAACGLAALLAGANPKNLLLAVAAAASIAQAGLSGGGQAVAYAVFALVGTVGVGAPVAAYVALGPRADKPLARLKDWMGAHNAVIMAVLCLVIGAKLIGDAITGLSG